MTVLDSLEADIRELHGLTAGVLSTFVIPLSELESLIAVARAAQRYREIALADPTSLDRPPAGRNLDLALAGLTTTGGSE